MKKWRVTSSERLMHFLSRELSQSRKTVRRLLEKNLCRVNGRVERFASVSLERGDRVELSKKWKKELSLSSAQEIVLYEDEFLKIIDKPQGLVCDARLEEKLSLYLVHRLDKETTGALLLAKSKEVKEELMQLFARREIKKRYLALVDGILKREEGTVESLLMRKGRKGGQAVWGSSHRGVRAITHWRLLKAGHSASLLECSPVTGRTHQIRVHMAEMGHPILVDRHYATEFRSKLFVSRYLLHASSLQFVHRGREIAVEASVPSDLKDAYSHC